MWCINYFCLYLLFGVLLLLKFYIKFTTGVYKGKERLDGKTAIVTGSNSGIGLECAKDFAKRGARVIMVCRDLKKAENVKKQIVSQTGNTNILIKHVDFLSLVSIRKCAKELLLEEQKIDILLNNAGIYSNKFRETEDGMDETMQANHFGPFLFTNILLGKIKQSSPSRIVNVSSIGYRFAKLDLNHLKKVITTAYTENYSNSKICNVLFTNELAKKLRGTGVTANSLHPGAIATDIIRGFTKPIRFILKITLDTFFKSVFEGAQTSIYLCVSPEVKDVTGKYFEDCKMKQLTNGADDDGLAKKVWEISEEAVGLKREEKNY